MTAGGCIYRVKSMLKGSGLSAFFVEYNDTALKDQRNSI
jgi:hypothetical protein